MISRQNFSRQFSQINNFKFFCAGSALISVCLFLFSGCQSSKKKMAEDGAPQNLGSNIVKYNEGKLFIEDKIKNKKFSLNLETFLMPSKRLRIEAMGPLSSRVASVLVTENKIQALLYREKKYLAGDFPRVWERSNPTLNVISIPFSPAQLQAILLGDPLPEKDWSCEKLVDQEGRVCRFKTQESSLKKTLTWKKDESGKPVVLAESTRANLRFELKDTSSLSPKPEIFSLKEFPQYEFVDITPR